MPDFFFSSHDGKDFAELPGFLQTGILMGVLTAGCSSADWQSTHTHTHTHRGRNLELVNLCLRHWFHLTLSFYQTHTRSQFFFVLFHSFTLSISVSFITLRLCQDSFFFPLYSLIFIFLPSFSLHPCVLYFPHYSFFLSFFLPFFRSSHYSAAFLLSFPCSILLKAAVGSSNIHSVKLSASFSAASYQSTQPQIMNQTCTWILLSLEQNIKVVNRCG